MKKTLKQPFLLILMAFSLIFTSCESSGDDALLIEEQESVQVVEFTDGVPDFSNIDLSKEFSMDFSKIDVSKLTPVDFNNLDPTKPFPINATATSEGRFTPVPFVATMRGNNNRYVSSENGGKMTCNRSGVGPWEIFVFIPVPDGPNQFRIMGNTGRYMKVSSDQKSITCNDYLRNATKFEMITSGSGAYLRATRINRYISSENGAKPISCNRTWQLSWEKFTIAITY